MHMPNMQERLKTQQEVIAAIISNVHLFVKK